MRRCIVTLATAHVHGKSDSRCVSLNNIFVTILFLLNSCWFEIQSCIMSIICLSFTKRLLLHVINRIKLTQIKNTLWGKIYCTSLFQESIYMYAPGWPHTREKGTIYALLEKLYPYPLQTLYQWRRCYPSTKFV